MSGQRHAAARRGRSPLLAVLLLLPACAAPRDDEAIIEMIRRADYGAARARLIETAPSNPNDRGYMLDRAAFIPLAVADGVPGASHRTAERVYEFLRTQGLNDDKTIGSFVFGEGQTRIWKGDPFEQAMMFHFIGMLDGLRGDWGNLRAAEAESLFLLRDFSRVTGGARTRAAQRDALLRAAPPPGAAGEPDSIGVAYEPSASDFELGYAMKAIACRELGEPNELNESVDRLVQVAPRLRDFGELIRSATYNTVLVVDAGIGPEKIATGPDGVYADWRARSRSDEAPLAVRVGESSSEFPVVTDINRLADDLRWNNLEDLRKAKSAIGTGLLIGGTAVAASSDDSAARYAGLGAAVAGLLLKATARADTRHCLALPQRVYIALLDLRGAPAVIELQIAGRPESRLVLPAVPPGPDRGLVLRAARLPERAGAWASAGVVRYGNDASGAIARDGREALPWILGGRDVRTPSESVLADYRRAGLPGAISLNDLIGLYKAEGISIEGVTGDAPIGPHILEGGAWLYTPLPGSTGFARLYAREWPHYTPRSARVRELASSLEVPAPAPPHAELGARPMFLRPSSGVRP